MSICRVISYVVVRGCLLWPVRSLGKTLLAFDLLCFVLQGQTWLLLHCYSMYLLTSYFSFPVPCNEKDIFFCVLVLEGLIGLHGTIQFQLLQLYWLGYVLGLPWYWMVCLGNEQRSFSHFWDCTWVLHFRLFCWLFCWLSLWELLHFFYKGSLPTVVDIMVIWIKPTLCSPF